MVLAFGEYALDLPRRELRRGEVVVPIQPKAFDLLAYLIQHRDRVVGKDELLSRLWPDEVVTEWALTFSIKLVRQALNDRAGPEALVRTMHRRGFRFMGEVSETGDGKASAAIVPSASPQWPAAASTRWMTVLGGGSSGAFCGRMEEMYRLNTLLERSLTGEPVTALISGDAGIGKTRVASELAQRAAARGVLILAGRSDEGAPPVFWPWVQIIRAYLEAHSPPQFLEVLGAGSGDIARLVMTLRRHVPETDERTLDSEYLRLRMIDSLTSFLTSAARRQPLLLILDDLQWADASSLLVLRSLLEGGAAVPLMVLGTLRHGEVEPESALGRLLVLLRREQRCSEIHLHGLSRSEAGELLGGAGARDWLDSVYETTEGNPFFLGELWRDSNERGALTAARSADLHIPKMVRDVVLERIDRLAPATRDLLSLASVAGREFDLALLCAAGGITADAALCSIDEALRANVIAETSDRARLRFVHAIVQEALYGRLGGPRRADSHRRVALALEAAQSASGDDLPEIAHHFFRAATQQDRGPVFDLALRYNRAAGGEATRRLSDSEAAVFHERAVALLERSSDRDGAALAEALIELGWSHHRADEPEQSRRAFLRAVDIARRGGLKTHLARAALGIGRGPQGIGASENETIALLEEALMLLPPDALALRAMCMARLALGLCSVPGTLARRVELCGEAVAVARSLGDVAVSVWVFQYNRLPRGPMTLAQRRAALDEATALAEKAGGAEHEPGLHLLRIGDLLEMGDADGAYAVMETVEQLMRTWRLPWVRWMLLRFRAACAQQEGRWAESEALAEQALAAGQRLKHPYAPHFYVAHTCMQRVHHGEYAEVEPILEAYVSSPRAVPAWRAILAFLYGRNGKTGLMRREFETMAANDFADLPQDLTWLTGTAYLAEVCHMLGDRERATILYDLLVPWADHVVGLGSGSFSLGHTARYLGLLAATLGRDQEAEKHFQKAIEMHERLRARPWLAVTAQDYAQWLTARKRAAAARPLAATARRLSKELGLKHFTKAV